MGDRTACAKLATTLRDLHRPGDPLILPNVWDAAGARLVHEAGFAAVATSSGAVAESLGFADQEGTPAAEMFAAVGRVAASVPIAVTADLESGYRLSPDEFIDGMLAAGVVGCNLEDTVYPQGVLADPAAHADWLAGVRDASSRAGVDIVVNARVDVFLPGRVGSGVNPLAEALDRIRRYADAGADCVYPIGLTDPATIGAIVDGSPVPVNIMAVPGWIGMSHARDLGVARVSYGTGIWKDARAFLAKRLESVVGETRR
ncbi:isocitrate lyase/PEP mutase family protein [Spelaeicoccus albus]|uniref:2-methylisocitrate lyase-like PEP mutase family enzyme n=1 Tax=Spelaeicoccus albus TaxID=1280376 RepID=A0A7Z0D2R3_9MICO|nr:isocitrate lyase/phosphoenolpyruvate mutase family protein [Spelaeicoccus albus]NYI67787.1 2-methylisocitrate lyase-like PEP mutase family enzyme [Spelaeicoccus albus]